MSSNNKEKNKKERDPENDTTWFLINCIMQSEAGRLEKVNWDAVAEKLNIKTKGAALMRHQRLLSSYGLTASYTPKVAGASAPSPAGDSATSEPNTPVKTTSAKTTPAKKRKLNKRKRQDPEPEPQPEPEAEAEPEDAKDADDETEDNKNNHDAEEEA